MASLLEIIKRSSVAVWIGCLLGIFVVGILDDIIANAQRRITFPVLQDGCRAVGDIQDSTSCVPNPDGKLLVWIGIHDCNAVQVELDNRILQATRRFIHDGCQLQFSAEGQQPISLLRLSDSQSGVSLWRFKIDRTKPGMLAWTERIKRRADADLGSVAAEMQQRTNQQSNSEQEMDFSLASGVSLYQRGLRDLAAVSFRQTMEYAQRARWPSVASEAAYRLAFTLIEAGMYQEARAALLDAQRWTQPSSGRAMIRISWAEGRILEAQQHLAEAADVYRKILVDAERLSAPDWTQTVAPVLGVVLAELDRRNEAEQLVGTLDQLLVGANECYTAMVLANKGWILLHLAEDKSLFNGRAMVGKDSINEVFLQALANRNHCLENRSLANIYNGLSQTALLEARFLDTQHWLDKARQIQGLQIEDDIELLEIEARLAIKQRSINAANRLLDKMKTMSQTGDTSRRLFECRAAVGKIEVLKMLNQTDANILNEVKSCLDPKSSGLTPFHMRILRHRVPAMFTVLTNQNHDRDVPHN